MWYAPAKLPIAKNGRARALIAFPLPEFTSVPEPQPSTSCMQSPKTKAPPTMANPTGAWAPTISAGWLASSGMARAATTPMEMSCATSPAGSRRRMKARHGPAKPKRSPSSVMPKPSPISSSSPYRAPASAATESTAARTPASGRARPPMEWPIVAVAVVMPQPLRTCPTPNSRGSATSPGTFAIGRPAFDQPTIDSG